MLNISNFKQPSVCLLKSQCIPCFGSDHKYFYSVPETKKEKKIKQRKSPLKINCLAQLGAISDSLLNKFLEIECQLKAKDKEEKDKSDAKNELEELVYSIR